MASKMLLWLIFTDFYVYIVFVVNKCCIHSFDVYAHYPVK